MGYVDAIRYMAKIKPHVPIVNDLRQYDNSSFQGIKNVIILLHGLLSTDIGTFDGFIRKLEADPLSKTTMLAGWPHDTLLAIVTNGEALVSQLKNWVQMIRTRISFCSVTREAG